MVATQKIVLNPSRDIPFNKLVLSQANVRRVKAGVSIEALAESIARRSLLQSLSVRPVLDAEGNETGTFEVPAGGIVMRDLFQEDEGGWFQDPALLDRLVAERLAREADAIRAEGWQWVEAAPDFPYGHRHGLRPLPGTNPLTEAVEARLAEFEAAIEAFQNRPPKFDPAGIVRAGVFVSIDRDGALRVERGYVRPEAWVKQLPATSGELWDALVGADADTRAALFAHCVALTINALHEPWNRRPGALAHADRLAQAVGLDMAAADWVRRIRPEPWMGRTQRNHQSFALGTNRTPRSPSKCRSQVRRSAPCTRAVA
ncbi:MAG: hypothetical protein ACYCT1_17200 [Steroidobacteraceae bacterium]